MSKSDDSHLVVTMRFMEKREMDKLSHDMTHAVLLIRKWKLAWLVQMRADRTCWRCTVWEAEDPQSQHKPFIIDEVKMQGPDKFLILPVCLVLR